MSVKKQKITLFVLLVVLIMVQIYNIYKPQAINEIFYNNYIQLTKNQQSDALILHLMEKHPEFLGEVKKNKDDVYSQKMITTLSFYLCDSMESVDKKASEAYCDYALFISVMKKIK